MLLIEDDLKCKALVRAIFYGFAGRITDVGTLEEARALLKTTRFDLVILDLNLPDGDGMDLLREIRADPRIMGVPVVVVTAHDRQPEARSSGCFHFLNKPFTARELRDLVPVVTGVSAG